MFLHGPNSPESCSRRGAVHIFKILPFLGASNFGDENGDPESILGPVQIQQGTEIGAWPSNKHILSQQNTLTDVKNGPVQFAKDQIWESTWVPAQADKR